MAQTTQRTSGGTIAWSIVLGLVGFLLMAAALHAAVRDPLRLHADMRSEKLAMLDGWHGSVLSAAFGSSHVHDGFDPRTFDAVLAPTPLTTRTGNLAVEGGSQSEQRAMALRFLSQLQPSAPASTPAAAPCFVLLELEAGANPTNDHLIHPRSINLYDWPTARLITHFVTPTMSPARRFGRIGFALAATSLYYSNVGMLSNTIFAPPLDREGLAFETEDDRRGLKPLTTAPGGAEHLRAEIAGLPRDPTIEPGLLTPGNSELVAQLAAAGAAHHVRPTFVYFVMPKLGDLRTAPDYPDQLTVGDQAVPILNLARPDRYPQLYRSEVWHDDAHLNGPGAQLLTKTLAEALLRWYTGHPAPHSCS